MRFPVWIVAVITVSLAGLAGTVAFLIGRSSAAITAPQPSPVRTLPDGRRTQEEMHQARTTPSPQEKASKQIVGIWAPAASGCGTGYGAAYAANGRFSEGDEFSGIEGRWTIRGDIMQRQNILEYEFNESDGNLVTHSMAGVDRLSITKLTAHDLVIDNANNHLAYVKCPEGRHTFVDGEQVDSQ